ncbi:MAG: hypothetical protein JNM84_27020 [Planctomycetes bacterium]|nr:hypothetical protein [Planctomycetota bacterium]
MSERDSGGASRRFVRAVDQLRRSCWSALLATAAVCALLGWQTQEWRLPALLLPLGEAVVLLWYFDARLRVFAAEVGEAIEREVSEQLRAAEDLRRARERGM